MKTRPIPFPLGTPKLHLFAACFIIASLAMWFTISLKRNQAEAQRQTAVAAANFAAAAHQKAEESSTSMPPK